LRRFRDLHERSHLVNAGKYLATMVTTTFSNLALNVNRAQYEPAWILFAVISASFLFFSLFSFSPRHTSAPRRAAC
jgi:Na+/melibiose symporter-like transporter